MKKIMFCFFTLVFVASLKADVDIKILQTLTNQITIAYGRDVMAKSDLAEYLSVLAAKDKPEGERPSEEEIGRAHV